MTLFFRSNISLILFPGLEACLEAYYNSYRYSSKLTQAGICSKVPVNSIFKQRICLIILTRFVDLLLERITTEHLICLKRNVRSFHSYQAYNSHVFFHFSEHTCCLMQSMNISIARYAFYRCQSNNCSEELHSDNQ